MSVAEQQQVGFAKVLLTAEQAHHVAVDVWFTFGAELESIAMDIDVTGPPNQEKLRALEDTTAKYRDALELLEWGAEPNAQVEFVAPRAELEKIADTLLESGSNRVGSPDRYVGMAEGLRAVQEVRALGLAELGAGKAILDQLESDGG